MVNVPLYVMPLELVVACGLYWAENVVGIKPLELTCDQLYSRRVSTFSKMIWVARWFSRTRSTIKNPVKMAERMPAMQRANTAVAIMVSGRVVPLTECFRRRILILFYVSAPWRRARPLVRYRQQLK